ncbi:MAG: hypothetical protein O2968_13365 [Acidobacteria bacterium]|nr:hypothetical protein [Acidobacteriota bacterium]
MTLHGPLPRRFVQHDGCRGGDIERLDDFGRYPQMLGPITERFAHAVGFGAENDDAALVQRGFR